MDNKEAITVLHCINDMGGWSSDTYIALDLAIKALETGEVYMTGEDYNLYMEGYKAGKKDFEPKQGEWVNPEDCFCYQCSNCGEYTNNEKTVEDGLFTYCPKCGAKMKGGAENETPV